MAKKTGVTETAAVALEQEAVAEKVQEETVTEAQDPDTMGFEGKEGI